MCIVGRTIGCGECPGENNVLVSGADERQNDLAVCGYVVGDVQVADFDLDLLGGSLLNFAYVLKAVCVNGNEVERAVVNGDQTGDVCKPCGVLAVCGLHRSDLVGSDAVVGGGEADVGFQSAQLEVVVALSLVFTGDLNALDGDEHCLLACQSGVGQRFGIRKDLGEVYGSDGLDGGVENLNGCIDQLEGAVVEVLLTGGENGHSCLDARLNGIGCQTVDVVTALIVEVLQIQAVGAVIQLLGKDTGYDALYHERCIVLGCCILCKGGNLKLGNLAVEGLLHRVALGVLDGRGEHVGNVCLGSLVNVDGNEARLGAFLYGNTLGDVDRPFNGVCNVADHNLADHIVVGGGFLCIVLIKTEQIVACLDQAFVLGACGKHGDAQSQEQEDRK